MGKFIKCLKTLAKNYDTRQSGKVIYSLEELWLIIIIGKFVGMEDILACLMYAQDNIDFLRTLLPYDNGLPSKNTLYRALENTKKIDMQMLFGLLIINNKKEQIAIDGKTIRGSKRYRNKGLHILNAYLVNNKVPIASITLKSKECEITTLPNIINSINVDNKVITIDAIGTHTKVIDSIIKGGGSFILPVKENQKTLYTDLEKWFIFENFNIKKTNCYKKEYSGFDRREIFISSNISYITEKYKWSSVKSVGCVKYKGSKGVFTRYFICSDILDVNEFASIVRNHWQVEVMHWYLDMVYKEDDSLLSNYSSVENYDIICKFVYSIIVRIKDNFNCSTKKLLQLISRNPSKYIPDIFDSLIY